MAGPSCVTGSKNCEASPETFGVTGPSRVQVPRAAERAAGTPGRSGTRRARRRGDAVERAPARDRAAIVDVVARIRAVADLLAPRRVRAVAVALAALAAEDRRGRLVRVALLALLVALLPVLAFRLFLALADLALLRAVPRAALGLPALLRLLLPLTEAVLRQRRAMAPAIPTGAHHRHHAE